MSLKRKKVKDSDKLAVLERIIKNLYHAKEIEYHLHDFKFLTGYVVMLDINDIDDIPKLHDCCDMGLENDIRVRRTRYDKELHEYRPIIDCEIWLNENPYEIIESLRKELKKVEDDGKTEESVDNKT